MVIALQFTVVGTPAPQGSKNPYGGESNPRTKPWRAAVSAQASEAMGSRPLIDGPVAIVATFCFTRPKGHYGTGRNATVLKANAPRYVATIPDLDKLQRAIGDSLSGVCIRDDRQIACWHVQKVYAEKACAEITVQDLVARAAVVGAAA